MFNSGQADILHLLQLTRLLFLSARGQKEEQIRALDFGLAHHDLPEELEGTLLCPRSCYVTSIRVTLPPTDALSMLKP